MSQRTNNWLDVKMEGVCVRELSSSLWFDFCYNEIACNQ